MKTINETNYVDKAEKAIRSLRDKAEQQRRGRGEPKIVTTSKIRNLLAMTAIFIIKYFVAKRIVWMKN